MEGYKYMFPDKNLITVWSAPNYCYRCGNVASILEFNEHLDRRLILFRDVPDSGNMCDVSFPCEAYLFVCFFLIAWYDYIGSSDKAKQGIQYFC